MYGLYISFLFFCLRMNKKAAIKPTTNTTPTTPKATPYCTPEELPLLESLVGGTREFVVEGVAAFDVGVAGGE